MLDTDRAADLQAKIDEGLEYLADQRRLGGHPDALMREEIRIECRRAQLVDPDLSWEAWHREALDGSTGVRRQIIEGRLHDLDLSRAPKAAKRTAQKLTAPEGFVPSAQLAALEADLVSQGEAVQAAKRALHEAEIARASFPARYHAASDALEAAREARRKHYLRTLGVRRREYRLAAAGS